MSGVSLHPQLESDCHLMGRGSASVVLLHRDSSVPWFILVPDTAVQNLLAMPEALLAQVMSDARLVSQLITGDLGYPRVNVASIGNLVPQLHLHVVGRRPGDSCWPKPVWGNLGEPVPYSQAEVLELRSRLSQCGLNRERD